MKVAELIEILKDEPQDWVVYAEPEYPNAAGLKPEDRETGRITGFSQSYRNPDGGGVVALSVYTDFDGSLAD